MYRSMSACEGWISELVPPAGLEPAILRRNPIPDRMRFPVSPRRRQLRAGTIPERIAPGYAVTRVGGVGLEGGISFLAGPSHMRPWYKAPSPQDGGSRRLGLL